MNKTLRATGIAHLVLDHFLKTGETAVDATAGNGYDTLYLAKKVGKQGRVYAFDIQEQALEQTRRLLDAENCLEQTVLVHDSHEKIDSYIKEPAAAIIYNLGYLPGGDKGLTTTAEATLSSLQKALAILAPGGIISVVAYPGHPGGEQEVSRVEGFLQSLVSPPWHVLTYKRLNGARSAPCLLLVEKEKN